MSQPPASAPEPEPEPQPYHPPPAEPGPYPPPPAEPPPYYPQPPGPGEAWPPPPEPAAPSKTISILALVFGGAALLLGLIPVIGIFLGGLFGIAAIVLGIIGIFISHRLFAIIGIALAVIGLVVAIIVNIAAGRTVERIIDEWPTNLEDLTSEDADPEDEQGGESPQEDEAQDGTDPNAPLPAGSEIDTGNWKVSFSNVVPDAADDLLTEDDFNEPPDAGFQYFMFQVNATYEGNESSSPWLNLYLGVYIDGVLYEDDFGDCGLLTIPNPYTEAPEVYAGGTSTGNFCVEVRSEGVENALIAATEDYSPRFFVEIE